MIEFKRVEVCDRAWVNELLKQSRFYGCEYTFGNNYMWSEVYDIKIAQYKGFYVVKNKYGFLFPAGSGDICEVINALKETCDGCLCFTNADKNSVELLERLYKSEIEISTNRDYYDYVYDFDALASLAGRKFHSKRNHLNRFYENDWSFEFISPDNIEECADMHNKWCDENNIYADRDKLKEAGAIIKGMERFFELGFVGGIIRVDGVIEGYTFGEPLVNCYGDTFVIHAEKAFTKTQGTYTAINREFVNRACSEYRYINREEDMGLENLRKAKMSYRPAFMVEKYCVRLK